VHGLVDRLDAEEADKDDGSVQVEADEGHHEEGQAEAGRARRAVTLVAVIADTHLPRGARRLPESCLERLRGADLVLHAGDIAAASALEELRALGPPVAAVHGNVDSAELHSLLPAERVVEAEGARIALVHDAGPRHGRLERMHRRFGGRAEAVVFGHSHLPLHEVGEDGFQIFNPGSPTDRRRAPADTMGLARVRRGRVTFELVELA
jgi:putative phosphoesterase